MFRRIPHRIKIACSEDVFSFPFRYPSSSDLCTLREERRRCERPASYFWVKRTLRNLPGPGLWHNHEEQGMDQQVTLTRQALKTPRAAAVAGIVFAVLFTTSIVLIRLALPEDLRGTSAAAWLQGNAATVSLALTLVPFAGIAFLWFMGVVRDRLGTLEDQFFSTVFFGSGLLFLAMIFASAAVAGGSLASYA